MSPISLKISTSTAAPSCFVVAVCDKLTMANASQVVVGTFELLIAAHIGDVARNYNKVKMLIVDIFNNAAENFVVVVIWGDVQVCKQRDF